MSSSDRTFSKVALYSAVVAGFAYVGYKVVKESMNKWKESPSENGRLYVRRLSGSDLLLGRLGNAFSNNNGTSSPPSRNGGDGIRLKPFNVKERIKDMNLQALQFADTILALEKPSPPGVTRSLSSTPLSSPKSSNPPFDFRVSSCPQRLLQSREEELKHRLGELFHKPQKLLTPYEAKCLVALLHSEEADVLEKALLTILKCTAFSDNQVLLSLGRRLCEISDEDEVLRMTTILANALPYIFDNLDEQSIKLLYEKSHLPELKAKLSHLMKYSPHEDIKKNARICYMVYKPM